MPALNFSHLKVILLDRDGVINQEPGPILTAEKFLMIPNSAQAIAKINQKGWKCFVITNQAAFARGDLDSFHFEEITNKMHQELQKAGGHIDGQYFCPHHPDWDNGVRRDSPQKCSCRKPQTLMLEQAASEHGFSTQDSIFIGDSTSDFAAAQKWGIPSIGVKPGHAGKDGKAQADPTYWKNDLLNAVEFLIQHS